MAKPRDKSDAVLLEDDIRETMLGNPDYALEDDAFFDKYEPKRSRLRRKKALRARRRLEEYREAEELREQLADFYD